MVFSRPKHPLLPATIAALLVCGCAAISVPNAVNWRAQDAFGGGRTALPDGSSFTAGQLVVHADFPLAARHRLIRDLESLRVDVSQELDLPISDEPVHLYLFGSQPRYDAYATSRFPGFPARRAFFVETDTALTVYACWQDRIAEDLRHETTHGYVHAVMPGIPLWIDEGLSEFFELPRTAGGVHRDHVRHLQTRLLEGTWRPDIARLESLTAAAALTQDDYAEAWAWVHWLLRSTPDRRRLLQTFLADIRFDAAAAAPLSVRLVRTTEHHSLVACSAAVVEHIRELAALEGREREPTRQD